MILVTMKQVITYSCTLLLAVAFVLGAVTALSPALLASELDDTSYDDGADVQAVNHNTSRSNVRGAADDTNVCDGVTCSDGSCAPTSDECPASATISPDIYAHDEDREHRSGNEVDIVGMGDERVGDDVEVRQYDSRATADHDADGSPDVRDLGADNDTVLDRTQNHNASRSNQTGRGVGSDEGDIQAGGDGIQPMQDYNSTRSNRRKNTFFDPIDALDEDDDGDGVPTIVFDRIRDIRSSAPDVRCGSVAAAPDADDLWCWGHGVRAAATGDANEDGTVATSTRVLQYLSVRGDDVRGWTESERAEFARYRELTHTEDTPEAVTARITNLLLDNERIQALEIDDVEARVAYRAQFRLFGLIPFEREIEARGTSVADVTIDWPWYRFLARTTDAETIQDLFGTLSTVAGGGGGKATFQDFTISTE